MSKLYMHRTKKDGNKFVFAVIECVTRTTPNENGHYMDHKIVRLGEAPTRAKATAAAKKHIRYKTFTKPE